MMRNVVNFKNQEDRDEFCRILRNVARHMPVRYDTLTRITKVYLNDDPRESCGDKTAYEVVISLDHEMMASQGPLFPYVRLHLDGRGELSVTVVAPTLPIQTLIETHVLFREGQKMGLLAAIVAAVSYINEKLGWVGRMTDPVHVIADASIRNRW